MKQSGPIGVFDSGYGGLTILSEIQKCLPEYDYLYLGDNARSPYGTRSFEVVYEYTLEAVKYLFDQGCSLVILACNTASAKALRSIQQNDLMHLDPSKRVLGVIRPTAEELGNYTKTGHIGILATEGTVKSESYLLELQKFSPHIEVTQRACPMWVPLIENNRHLSDPGKEFIREDVESILMKDPKIDVLVLACTHYPLVYNYLRTIVPNEIQIISQGKIVAEKLADYLNRHPEMKDRCSSNATTTFLTTENAKEFDLKASLFLGKSLNSMHIRLA